MPNKIVVLNNEEVDGALDLLSGDVLFVDTETSGLIPQTCKLWCIQIGTVDDYIFFPWATLNEESRDKLRSFLTGKTVVAHNAKFDIKFLNWNGFNITKAYCTKESEAVLTSGRYFTNDLASILLRRFQVQLDKSVRSLFYTTDGTKPQIEQWLDKEGAAVWENHPEIVEYALEDIVYLPDLKAAQQEEAKELHMENVLWLENQLVPEVARIELRGVAMNVKETKKFQSKVLIARERLDKEVNDLLGRSWNLYWQEEFARRMKLLNVWKESHEKELQKAKDLRKTIKDNKDSENEIREKAKKITERSNKKKPYNKLPALDEPFKIGSPVKLRHALTKLCGMDIPTTKADWLEENISLHPAIEMLIEFRKFDKLAQFCELKEEINPATGRIHANFNQTGARSGRFSCFAGQTPVKTHRGEVPISEVQVGDYVWTHKERWRKVTAVLNQGFREVYDVRLCNGNVLTCTNDHRVLDSDGRWRKIYEHIKNMDTESGKPEESTGKIQVDGLAHIHGVGEGVQYNGAQYRGSNKFVPAGSREEGSSSPSLFSRESWPEKPYVREEGRPASRLERSGGGWQRVPDYDVEREKDLCPSGNYDEALGTAKSAQRYGRSSHRRQPEEQQLGQLGSGNKRRSQDYTLFTGKGQPCCSIEEINFSGSTEVYDLSVEEDHSFSVGGIFAHNCSYPNLQQIPARSKEGKEFRGLFRPRKGCKYVGADLAGIELVIMASLSDEKSLLDAIQGGKDIHCFTMSKIMSCDYDILVNLKEGEAIDKAQTEEFSRRRAQFQVEFRLPELLKIDEPSAWVNKFRDYVKTMTYGIAYGQTAFGASNKFHCPYEVAEKLIEERFFGAYPNLRAWIKSCETIAYERGFAENQLGRKRWFTRPKKKTYEQIEAEVLSALKSENRVWESVTDEEWESLMSKAIERANKEYRSRVNSIKRQGANFIPQSMCADMVKLAMILYGRYQSDPFNGIVLTIHDELIVECEATQADEVASKLSEVMAFAVNKFLPDVKTEVKAKIMDRWEK